MKRLGLLMGMGLALAASTYALSAETLRVLSYNVENLWDDEPDNTPEVWRKFLASHPVEERLRSLQYSDFAADTSNWYDPKILDAKIQHFVQVIKLAKEPEILALQEFESAGNESHVFDMHGKNLTLRKEFEKMGYHYFILGHQNEDKPVSVTPAIISKVPLTELPSVEIRFEDEPLSTSARNIQVAEYKEGSNRMLIFNNHWKSKIGGKKTENARIKVAEILKAKIAQEEANDPNVRVIVLGDLNSAYYERPILAIASGDENKMLGDRTTLLYNTWYDLPEDDRWETSFRGERQTLSAMLISDSFYQKSGIQYVDQSFRVIGQSGKEASKLLNADGTPLRWQVRKEGGYSIHAGKGYSDHLPLIATFKIESGNIKQKVKLSHKLYPVKESNLIQPKLDKVPVCSNEEIVSADTLDFQNEDSWFNNCIKIEGNFPLLGKNDEASYIQITFGGRVLNLTIAMTRSWDERPNVDDSRVKDPQMLPEYRTHDGNPRSNMCFQRRVLKGSGGVLKKALGRLGYYDGNIAVYIASREASNLVLTDLPDYKQNKCSWN